MIRNVTYNNKEITREINEKLGKSFSLIKRIKMGGNGSPMFLMHSASDDIWSIVNDTSSLNKCNIELRPNGILLGFRQRLEAFAWVILYSELVLDQTKTNIIGLIANGSEVRLNISEKRQSIFIEKLRTYLVN